MKKMFLDIERLKNSLNLQEMGKFEGKEELLWADGLKITNFRLPAQQFFDLWQAIQSSPIGRVNYGAGKTDDCQVEVL